MHHVLKKKVCYFHKVSDLVYLTDNTYKVEQVFTMERIVLRKFGFDLNSTDPVSTMEHFLQIAAADRMVNTCISHSSSKSWFLFGVWIIKWWIVNIPFVYYASTYHRLGRYCFANVTLCRSVIQYTKCCPVSKIHFYCSSKNITILSKMTIRLLLLIFQANRSKSTY